MPPTFRNQEMSGTTTFQYQRQLSAESVKSDSTLGYDSRGEQRGGQRGGQRDSTLSLSLRRRARRVSIPSNRSSFFASSTVSSPVYSEGFGFQQFDKEARGDADLETTLSITKESLIKEQTRTRHLTTELQAMQEEYESERNRRNEISSQLRKLTTAIEEIIGSNHAFPNNLSDESEQSAKRSRPVSDSTNARLDWIQNLFTAYVESVRQSVQPTNDSSFVSQSTASSANGRREDDYPSERIGRMSWSLHASRPNSTGTIPSSLAKRASLVEQGLTNNSYDQGSLASFDSTQDDDRGSVHGEEGDGLFCYIKGSAERTSGSASRPMSIAQANRHSAIIGDNLFCLSVSVTSEDGDALSSPRSAGSPSTAYPSYQEPLTPASDASLQEYGSAAIPKAVAQSRHQIVTSARPSDDAPTMSCRVGRTFDTPLGSNSGASYIRRKFTSDKSIVGRSSVTAYQSR